jgi:hypothetical protein
MFLKNMTFSVPFSEITYSITRCAYNICSFARLFA